MEDRPEKKKDEWKCGPCGKTLKHKRQRFQHIETAEHLKTVGTGFCTCAPNPLIARLRLNRKLEKGRYHCSVCGWRFLDDEQLDELFGDRNLRRILFEKLKSHFGFSLDESLCGNIKVQTTRMSRSSSSHCLGVNNPLQASVDELKEQVAILMTARYSQHAQQYPQLQQLPFQSPQFQPQLQRAPFQPSQLQQSQFQQQQPQSPYFSPSEPLPKLSSTQQQPRTPLQLRSGTTTTGDFLENERDSGLFDDCNYHYYFYGHILFIFIFLIKKIDASSISAESSSSQCNQPTTGLSLSPPSTLSVDKFVIFFKNNKKDDSFCDWEDFLTLSDSSLLRSPSFWEKEGYFTLRFFLILLFFFFFNGSFVVC